MKTKTADPRRLRARRILRTLTRLAAYELDFNEVHSWRTGQPGGSPHQLWSASAYLGRAAGNGSTEAPSSMAR